MDYKEVKRWGYCPSILKMYSEYVSHVLEKCALKLATGRVKFHFLLCNCMEIAPFLPSDLKYDRVATSNLADYVPLTNILDICEPLLNPGNPSSVIITEFINWRNLLNLQLELVQTAASMPIFHSFRSKILEDTGNPAIAYSTGYEAFVEYQDYSDKFVQFLRACLLVYKNTDEHNRRRTWTSVAVPKSSCPSQVDGKLPQGYHVKWLWESCRMDSKTKVRLIFCFGRKIYTCDFLLICFRCVFSF